MKPVNLNQYRKLKARADKKARADQNATKFGRTRSEKLADASELTALHSFLDAHKREPKPE